MGHEVVGVVEAAGPDASAWRSAAPGWCTPGSACECAACQDGRENACPRGRNIGVARPGGYADHLVVPHSRYLIDIEGLDPSWAATMACSGLTAYGAASKVLPLPTDAPVVVIGVGGVGLTAVATLSALKAICAVDMSEANLSAAARELGASITVTADARTCPEGARGDWRPVDAVIDFVNNDQTASAAFDMLAKGGRMVQVGLFGGEVTIPTALLALKMLTIEGSFVGTLPEFHEVVELAKQGRAPRIPVIDADLDLAGVTPRSTASPPARSRAASC